MSAKEIVDAYQKTLVRETLLTLKALRNALRFCDLETGLIYVYWIRREQQRLVYYRYL